MSWHYYPATAAASVAAAVGSDGGGGGRGGGGSGGGSCGGGGSGGGGASNGWRRQIIGLSGNKYLGIQRSGFPFPLNTEKYFRATASLQCERA